MKDQLNALQQQAIQIQINGGGNGGGNNNNNNNNNNNGKDPLSAIKGQI